MEERGRWTHFEVLVPSEGGRDVPRAINHGSTSAQARLSKVPGMGILWARSLLQKEENKGGQKNEKKMKKKENKRKKSGGNEIAQGLEFEMYNLE